MLLSVTGASGVGKSTALKALSRLDFGHPIRCVEFDSIGVPDGADTAWRHGAVEQWVRTAVEAEANGEHLMLFGQVPPGELLAAPSAAQLNGIAICVLHSSPTIQGARLLERAEAADSLVHHLRFGEWFRRHAEDPMHEPEVIQVESPVRMAWSRWQGSTGDDERWPVTIIDTDALSPEDVARRLEVWARDRLR